MEFFASFLLAEISKQTRCLYNTVNESNIDKIVFYITFLRNIVICNIVFFSSRKKN